MPRKKDGVRADPRWRSHIEPAPGELRVVQALINTAAAGREELSSPRALGDWLNPWGLSSRGPELEAADLAKVLEVRSDLEAVLRAGQSQPPAPQVIERLDRAAASSSLRVRFSSDGSARFEPTAAGIGEALGRLFEIVALAHRDRCWQRLKLCRREGCGAAFYDFSNGLSAKWCSSSCGDRLKTRTYRQRRKRYRAEMRRDRPS